MIELSVVIVNYRGWKHLGFCLDALQSFGANRFHFEVIVVDNCSNDGQLENFRGKYTGFLFLENSGNNGFSNACNLGAATSKGEWLLFLNPDIIATEAAIFYLLQTMRNRPGIAILSCRQKNSNGREERPYGLFPSLFTLNGTTRAIYRKIKRKEFANRFSSQKELIYPDWVSGSVIMISKQRFEQLGGWNENYWLYYEDVDLCRRAVINGGKVALNNRVTIIHNHGGATRISPRTAALTKAEVIISKHVYLSQHFNRTHAALLHLFVIINTLTIGTVTAFPGLFLFFITRLNIATRVYFRLIAYYLMVPVNASWLSPRSITMKEKKSH